LAVSTEIADGGMLQQILSALHHQRSDGGTTEVDAGTEDSRACNKDRKIYQFRAADRKDVETNNAPGKCRLCVCWRRQHWSGAGEEVITNGVNPRLTENYHHDAPCSQKPLGHASAAWYGCRHQPQRGSVGLGSTTYLQ